MMSVLEAPPDAPTITISDLETEIEVYESVYGISTEALLGLIAEGNRERLASIRDAGFWRSAHDALERMKRYRDEQPENTTKDPKGSLVNLWPLILMNMRPIFTAAFRR